MARSSGQSNKEQARKLLETDLWEFAKYINPHYCYGDIHEEVFRWLAGNNVKDHQLLLMPRAHLKSHCIAVWCIWAITRDPSTSIVYLSAVEKLAKVQISAMKQMMLCSRYQKLWPEMLHKDEGKRDKWTAFEFNVDHPLRKARGIRDFTMAVRTIKGSSTGLHCEALVLDDVVIPQNAYTETGRREVRAAVSQFASIKNPDAITKAVGTIYHPDDIYSDFKKTQVKLWNEDRLEFDGESPLWEIKLHEVETFGDMMGIYLWPRTVSPLDGKGYGFNPATLAKIQAQYFGLGENAQFYAQYYNDPNDPSSEKISRDSFQFYKLELVQFNDGSYYYKDRRLSIIAAMDVAWTVNKSSDYTAIAVIGTDFENNTYVLSLVRFKTQDYDEYYSHVVGLYNEWGFRKLYIETNAGGTLVANEVKLRLRQNGANLVVEGKAATGNEGKKEEKHNAILVPRVKNGTVYFTKGGLTSVAIEEIVLERPPHDDLKDALTLAISKAVAPARKAYSDDKQVTIRYNTRFGGRIR